MEPLADGRNASSIGARVQALDLTDQGLVLGTILEGRGGDGRFAPTDLADLFDEIGLPRPPHLSNLLAALARRGLAGRGRLGRGRWRLTPDGRDRARQLLTADQMLQLAREAAVHASAVLGGAVHPTLPPWLAPPDLEHRIATFLETHPFSSNVFAMTRFPAGDQAVPDPVRHAIESAREACRSHGLELHLASDHAIVDTLWGNVAAHMWASKYGIAFFEDLLGRGINYNLAIEVGAMLIAGRRTALLRDPSVAAMPTDLVGQIYKRVEMNDPAAVSEALHGWASADLGLPRCAACP